MNIKISLFIGFFMALCGGLSASATALSVNCGEAGSLSGQIADPSAVTELTVTGHIDVRDLEYIADKLPSLLKLDISGAQIMAANYSRSLTGQESFAANEMPSMVFAGSGIQYLTLPSGLTSIDSGAFAHSALKSVVIPESVTTIGDGAFEGSALQSIVLPVTTSNIGANICKGCTQLKTAICRAVEIPASAFQGCTSLSDVVIGELVGSVGDDAFSGCTALTNVGAFGAKLRSVGDRAFYNSGVTALDFSASTWMSRIGTQAFALCSDLQEIAFPMSVSEVGDAAFLNDASLVNYTGAAAMETVPYAMMKGVSALDTPAILGQKAATVEEYALYGMSSLTEFNLPVPLTYIGDEAFAGLNSLKQMQGAALTSVPELGEDVWGDLDRPTVTLLVQKPMMNEFAVTPIWEDFKIRDSEDPAHGDDISLDPGTQINGRIIVFIDGDVLHVAHNGDEPLENVAVYDIMGRCLYRADISASHVGIDTTNWPSVNVFIVQTQNNSVKIAR